MTDPRFLSDEEVPYDGPIAIMRTFVLHSKTHVLYGLAALSFVAGREGDDEWAWAAEVEDALIDAFFAKRGATIPSRSQHYRTARAVLSAAFNSGRAQREIDLAVSLGPRPSVYNSRQLHRVNVPESALAVARAHATIYSSEVEFPADRHPRAVEFGLYRVAAKIAKRHPVTATEAAYCALKAFEEVGFEADWGHAAAALEGATSGRDEREASEANARVRAAVVTDATAGLFGGQE